MQLAQPRSRCALRYPPRETRNRPPVAIWHQPADHLRRKLLRISANHVRREADSALHQQQVFVSLEEAEIGGQSCDIGGGEFGLQPLGVEQQRPKLFFVPRLLQVMRQVLEEILVFRTTGPTVCALGPVGLQESLVQVADFPGSCAHKVKLEVVQGKTALWTPPLHPLDQCHIVERSYELPSMRLGEVAITSPEGDCRGFRYVRRGKHRQFPVTICCCRILPGKKVQTHLYGLEYVRILVVWKPFGEIGNVSLSQCVEQVPPGISVPDDGSRLRQGKRQVAAFLPYIVSLGWQRIHRNPRRLGQQ